MLIQTAIKQLIKRDLDTDLGITNIDFTPNDHLFINGRDSFTINSTAEDAEPELFEFTPDALCSNKWRICKIIY
jgi:hypothetical protein